MSSSKGRWMGVGPEIRFYIYTGVAGKIARFFYRLRHWDWRDWTPPPPVPLSEVVARFGGPVYGLIDDFLALTADGRGGDNGIGLHYQREWLRDEEASPGVTIETRKRSEIGAPWPWTAFQIWDAGRGAAFSFSSRSFRKGEMRKHRDPFQLFDDVHVEALRDFPAHIAGFPAAATVWRWRVPDPVHVMLLRNDATDLLLSAFGLTTDEFRELTAHIRPLDEDAVARYEADADMRVKEYEHRLQGEHRK